MLWFFDNFNLDFVNSMELLFVFVFFMVSLIYLLDDKIKTKQGRYTNFGISVFLFGLLLQLSNSIYGFAVYIYIGNDEVDITAVIITLLFIIGAIMALLPTVIGGIKDNIANNKVKVKEPLKH